jgi:hypothetical protein
LYYTEAGVKMRGKIAERDFLDHSRPLWWLRRIPLHLSVHLIGAGFDEPHAPVEPHRRIALQHLQAQSITLGYTPLKQLAKQM